MDEALRLKWKEEIKLFAQKLGEYGNGDMDKKAYKGFSGGFGSYAQRQGDRHMLRLRMTGGRLTAERLGFIADCVERHGIRRLKLTTCQTVQLHDLEAEALVECMEGALDVDIVTRGGGGDFPRNVMVNPLSGVERGECFDVLPAAQAAGDYLLGRMGDVRLPRKLKVGFSSSPANETHVSFRDLGFAARPDGCFDVYCAGGLGPNPKLGVRVDCAAAPEDVCAYLETMLRLFAQHGNFENRAKARTRYLQDSLGVDGLRDAFHRILSEVRAEGCPKAVLAQPTAGKKSEGALSGARVIAQKQPGLYAVTYHPLGGLLPADMPRKLHALALEIPGAEWRVGPDNTLYCVNLTAVEASRVLEATSHGGETLFEHSVACIGATVCQQGVRDSQAALSAMVEAARKAGFADGVLPRIRISGCPSSCGAHQAGALGFQGGVKLVAGQPQPAYVLSVDGQEALPNQRFGTVLGSILEAELPGFIVALGRLVEENGGSFAEWYPGHQAEFAAFAERYTA